MTPSPTTAQLTQHSLHFLCVHRHHTNPKQQCQERLTHVSACALDPKQRPQSSQPAGLPWSRCAPVAARARARPRAALAGGLLVVQPAGQLGRQCVAPERGRKLRGARRGIRPYWLQQPSEAGAAQATACMAPCMAVMHASYPTLYKNLSKQFQGHEDWVTGSDAIRMRACLKQDLDARHRPQSSPRAGAARGARAPGPGSSCSQSAVGRRSPTLARASGSSARLARPARRPAVTRAAACGLAQGAAPSSQAVLY